MDDNLLRQISEDAAYLAERGYPIYAQRMRELVKRHTTLTECHRLLAAREERLTAELVALRD